MQVAVPVKQLPGTRYGLLVDMASLPVEITEDHGGTFGYCQFRIVRTEVHIVRSRGCRAIGRPLLHTHKSCLHITRWFFRILGNGARAAVAAPPQSLAFFFLGGGLVIFPVALIYTGAIFWTFRGKSATGYEAEASALVSPQQSGRLVSGRQE